MRKILGRVLVFLLYPGRLSRNMMVIEIPLMEEQDQSPFADAKMYCALIYVANSYCNMCLSVIYTCD